MIALWKKELLTFFSSLTGYLVMAVFLLMSGLFLWVIPGNLNILYGGYASLEGLFFLAPWLFLFLVPAVAMRLLSEEKKTGTLELLLTRPVPLWELVAGKFLGGFTVVLAALVPTLIYFVSLWQLAQPVGNVDSGAIWGSYIGLVLLAGAYLSIGLFTSALTDNQVVAFVLAALLSFFFYNGFDALASIPYFREVASFLSGLGIDAHYRSISRGVVDLRDVTYFLGLILVFLGLTRAVLSRPKGWTQFSWLLVVVIFANLGSSIWFFRWDLTAEKRFSLADVTKTFLTEMEAPVFARVYLEGNLNAGFERLGRSTQEMLDELKVYAGDNLEYRFVDPQDDAEESHRALERLKSAGLSPVPVFESSEDGTRKRTLVYPYLVFRYYEQEVSVNLLENLPGLAGAENLNASIEGLEYKLTDALRRLTGGEKPRIAFWEGQGELDELDVMDATDALAQYYQVERGNPGNNLEALLSYKALIVARPSAAFREQEKFIIDQYLMQGGRVLWLLDAINVSMDSLRHSSQTVGMPLQLNLEDQLFRYGFRINPVLVQDLQSGVVPVNVSQPGESARFVPMPWHFNPLLNTNREHPVTRHLNVVKGEFVSSVDTVGHNPQVARTPLLQTSRYSRTLESPVFISMARINEPPNRELFHQPNIPVAYAAEGVFSSVFKNRVQPPGVGGLPAGGVKSESVPTRMIVVADGDIIRNEVRRKQSGDPKILPLGFDEVTNQNYGNKQFILNALNFLTDDEGWMALRSRSYTLRLLNTEKLAEEASFWRMLNVGGPLLLVILAGVLIPFIRRRRFGS